jgi:FKBP-type peptidyl-prolyl cis-trans isomerase
MTANKHKIWVVLLLLASQSCNFSKYEGFDKLSNGIYYQLLQIGESDIKPHVSDYITTYIEYKTLHDSVFYRGSKRFQLNKPHYEGSIEECFAFLAKGDRARFIISANDFYSRTLKTNLPPFFAEDDKMIAEIEMIDIQSVDQFNKERDAFMKWIEDFGEYEEIILKQYIEKEKIDIPPTPSGLYHIIVRKGTGKKVAIGDTVIFHYIGRFLDGKFFDSSRQRNEPFGFVYGQEWQVVKGLDEGIGMMREGEKALFIVPSQLAFGKTGSSTGIIPPYTSLIFEVDLLEVR